MKYAGFIVALLLMANAGKSDQIKVLGSKKRNHPQRAQINIEDIIRAEEDPEFPQYVKERERQKREEKAAILAYDKQRQADEDAYKSAQRQYIEEEHEQQRVDRESAKERKTRAAEQKAWAQQQEQYRKEYIADLYNRKEKFNSERVARIQKVLSLQRMPASANW